MCMYVYMCTCVCICVFVHVYFLYTYIIYLYNIQLNSCTSNSCNSKDHLNGTNSSVLSEFTSKPSQENSFNSNSHNSKNHLNRTNAWVPWTYFSSCNSNFGFGVQFFHPSIFYCRKFEFFNSNVLKSLNLFEFDCWWLTRQKWPQKGSIMK